jgi:predicted PurR-regulated permease PerM
MATLKRVQAISFLVMLLVVLVIVLFILKPFVNILALGVILAILFRPIYRWFLKWIDKPSVASLLTIVLILLIIILPLWLFGQVLFNELVSIYNRYRVGEIALDRNQIVHSLPPQLQNIFETFSRDINSFIGRFTADAFQTFSGLLSNVAGFFVSFFMLFFIVYYLLRDGDHIKQVFMDISPIASKQEYKLFDRVVEAVNGVVKGSFLVALIQGLVATIGFFIFGVPEPFLWGLFTVVAALVPTVGTSISLIPAIAYLVITGQVPNAIGMAIWGAAAVGTIDNFISPKLIGSRTKLHPVLVLLSVIGGIQFFGILGFLIGPILMAVFVALIEMYRTDFKDYLQP